MRCLRRGSLVEAVAQERRMAREVWVGGGRVGVAEVGCGGGVWWRVERVVDEHGGSRDGGSRDSWGVYILI